jgi:hypothetical protein
MLRRLDYRPAAKSAFGAECPVYISRIDVPRAQASAKSFVNEHTPPIRSAALTENLHKTGQQIVLSKL